MIEKIDYLVLTVFVIGLVVMCFFQKCSLDIYFLVFGFAIAAMSAITLFMHRGKKPKSSEKGVTK